MKTILAAVLFAIGSCQQQTASTQAAATSAQPAVIVHTAQTGATVAAALYGVEIPVWEPITTAQFSAVLFGLGSVRWPGGDAADRYQWRTNTYGPGTCGQMAPPDPASTFDNFIAFAHAANLSPAITVNYGSDRLCTGPANPAQAGAWAAYAKAHGVHVAFWTPGNEQYTPNSVDLHKGCHQNPTCYATNEPAFYAAIKAADPSAQVCVDANPHVVGWDTVVLKSAKYDCIEVHHFAQNVTVSDADLLQNGPSGLAGTITHAMTDLGAAGRDPGTPIFMGAVGCNNGPPGKQSVSIVCGLFSAMAEATMATRGIQRSAWHLGFGPCRPPSQGGDFDKAVYGFQDYGSDGAWSDGTQATRCNATVVPTGTPFPAAIGIQIAESALPPESTMVATEVDNAPNVRAWAAKAQNGTVRELLVNLDEDNPITVQVSIDGETSGTGAQAFEYGKSDYAQSAQNVWVPPNETSLGAWQGSIPVTLPPWSMTSLW
jgi:hypothetical protein